MVHIRHSGLRERLSFFSPLRRTRDMECSISPHARFNILKGVFEEDDGELRGCPIGGRSKATMLHLGQYCSDAFKEPKVNELLNGLAKLFSCRYAALFGGSEDGMEKTLKELTSFHAFDKYPVPFQQKINSI